MSQHRIVELNFGDSVDLMLPSGRIVNVEVTPDDTDVTIGSRVLYHEARYDGKYVIETPRDTKGILD